MNFNEVAIVSIKRSDYKIHFWYMSKDDVMYDDAKMIVIMMMQRWSKDYVMTNSNLNLKNELL